MYCGNCGTKNDDTAAFCQACGSRLTAPQTNAGTETLAPKQPYKKTGIIAAAVIVVVIAFVGWLLFGGRGYKATVEEFFDASMDGDIESVLELIPKDVIRSEMESEGFDQGDFEAFAQEAEDELRGMMSFGGFVADKMNLEIDITGDTDITGTELKELQDEYKAQYDVKVKKAKDVHVTVSIDAGILSGAEDVDIPVIKVGRSWYLDVGSF